jgi:glycosyltransferase involved in cell wall biosynthesis
MKILRLYTRLPPLSGGMENHIAQLTREQVSLGHDVSIYFNHGSSVTSNDIKITKFPLYKIKPQFIGIFIFYFLVIVRMFVNRERFDIIHIHGDWSSLVFSGLVKKLAGANKLIMTIHDQIINKLLRQKMLAFCLRFVDIIFTTGFETANQLSKLTLKKIIVQPSGINEIFFSDPNRNVQHKKFTILTVANLFPKKNIELVLEIAKELVDYSFIIVGEGTHRRALENIILRENIKNVELVGFKSAEILKKYYFESDCYLLTSFAEGTPTSMLEAMACGLPIVCSDAGGVKSILHNKNYVVENNSKSMFINCLSLLASNKKLRDYISEKNMINSKDYTWKNVAQNINKYFIN